MCILLWLWRQRRQLCSWHHWQAVCVSLCAGTHTPICYQLSLHIVLRQLVIGPGPDTYYSSDVTTAKRRTRLIPASVFSSSHSQTRMIHSQMSHTGMTSPQIWVTAILLCLRHSHYEARATHDDWLIADDTWLYLNSVRVDNGLMGRAKDTQTERQRQTCHYADTQA